MNTRLIQIGFDVYDYISNFPCINHSELLLSQIRSDLERDLHHSVLRVWLYSQRAHKDPASDAIAMCGMFGPSRERGSSPTRASTLQIVGSCFNTNESLATAYMFYH